MKPTSDKDVIKPITSVLSPSVLSALSNVQNGCAVQVLQRESRRETPLQLYNRFDAIQPRARPDSCRVAGVGSAYTVSKMKPTSDKDVIKPITSVLSPSVLSALSNVQNGCAVQVLQRESRRETPLQLYNRFDAIQPRARPDSCRVGIV
ncbi:hypothetical protein Bca4012_044933 [Brassica carinata]